MGRERYTKQQKKKSLGLNPRSQDVFHKKESFFQKKRKNRLHKEPKVIRLEDRGRYHGVKWGKYFWGISGILCILYCLSIGLFFGFGSRFYYIWAVIGVFCLGLSYLSGHPKKREKIPQWIRRTFWICFGLGMALLVFVEALVCTGFSAKGAPAADYLIVLGAQWKTTGPSKVLQYRLDKAAEYLRENPETVCIVSGGQGGNEPIPEAEGMKQYLAAKGIPGERILEEATSTNTYENLRNSGTLLKPETDSVVIVTNNFHIFRAVQLAKAGGYDHVVGLAARSYLPMQPNNMFREFIGVLKDFLMGNLMRAPER